MEYYFKMGGTGIQLDGIREECPVGKDFNLFQIEQKEYENLEEKIKLKVRECSAEELQRLVEKNDCKNGICIPFAHCAHAVYFKAQEWGNEEITFYLNPDCYGEPAWSLKQLFCIIGMQRMFLFRDAMILHASYIIVENEAILFTAPSQTGKSTQADLWNLYANAEIINGDRTLLKKRENTWFADGIPMCGSSNICKNKCSKIRAIIVLEQGDENRILPLSMAEKYKALLLGSQYSLQELSDGEKMHKMIIELISQVSIVKFSCRPDASAVFELKRYLETERNSSQ